jgi:hypothetical protein
MADTNEIEDIKQLLRAIVAHLEKLTSEVQELRPAKQTAKEHRTAEIQAGVSLVADIRSLRKLADTTLGGTDVREG